MDRALHGGIAAALLTASLAACSQEAAPPVEANPDAPAGISIADGRLNLPAVSGNPGSVYFTIANDSDEEVTIAGAYVDGAESAAMHETAEMGGAMQMQDVSDVTVPAGESFTFAPGAYHIMAMNLDPALQPGGETEVTLTFATGDKASFKARLLAPGDDGSGD